MREKNKWNIINGSKRIFKMKLRDLCKYRLECKGCGEVVWASRKLPYTCKKCELKEDNQKWIKKK